MIQITSQNFDEEILQSKIPVLLLWSAPMDMNSTVMYLAMQREQNNPKFKVANVVVNENPELALKYSIRDLPYVVGFESGMVASEARSIKELEGMMKYYA